MSRIFSHRDLDVWKDAMELAMAVFGVTKGFPAEEKYSLTDQIRRSSRSVAANISEAWMKRRYEAAFVLKLNDSLSETAETQTWLDLALRCGYLAAETHQELDQACVRIIGRLIKMSQKPEDWVLKP